MEDSTTNFTDFDSLYNILQEQGRKGKRLGYWNMEEYEGMVFSMLIAFDPKKSKYDLDVLWGCYGLDFYGDTLEESYMYEFESLEKLLDYLLAKYKIKLTDIPQKCVFNHELHPSVIRDSDKKEIFEAAWKQFQEDFAKGIFLDPELKMVYTSLGN